MVDKPLKVYPGQWPETIVCGASGTGRTTFAYKLADRYNGHVIDTSDVLTSVRTMAADGQYPELFYQDAEDLREFDGEVTQSAEELAAARLRAADVLFPAVEAVKNQQPRLHYGEYGGQTPHTVVTGRHALPSLAFDFVVILIETEEQIRANLRSYGCPPEVLDLRARTSVLVQQGLMIKAAEHRQNQPHCDVIYTDARPWEDAVERAYNAMDDWWDYRTALGGLW